jgi:hypothetical protein
MKRNYIWEVHEQKKVEYHWSETCVKVHTCQAVTDRSLQYRSDSAHDGKQTHYCGGLVGHSECGRGQSWPILDTVPAVSRIRYSDGL